MNEANDTQATEDPARCAAPAGYARPTLQDLRDHLVLLRKGLAPAKHMAYRQTGEHVQICQNLEVCCAALTATIMSVEAQIKAHTQKLTDP